MTSTLPLDPAMPGQPYSPSPPAGAEEARPPEDRRGRRWLLGFWVLAFIAFLIPSAGKMTFETKLGVAADPWKFIGDLGELWHDRAGFGGIADQYFGYVFPMLPYYGLTDLLQIPVWLAERLWLSLVVTAAFWGALRLAERLGFGTSATRLLGAACYALWPVFTIIVGSTSAGALPGAVLPWVLLPLTDHRLAPRVAAARSALIIPFMGGVNAASTLAALLPALLYVLTRTGPRRTRLVSWWLPFVALACLWWVVPLLLLGAYGENFLPFIETAHNTTTTMSATEVLRGTGNWVAYLNFGEPWLPAGWTMATVWLPIIGSAVAAALGLAGLARRDLPERRWLVLTVTVVALLTLAGYGGALGAPFADTIQSWLDGWLSPFRNIYKFQPGLALAFAFGIMHFTAVSERRGSRGVRSRSWVPGIAAVVVLPGLLLPYANGDVLQPGGFDELPKHWEQTADWLEEYSPDSRAMVVPATAHGTYEWGKPIDQPLDVLADSRWAQRDYVPFGTAGSRRAMDAVDQALMSGTEVPGLQDFLARAGLHYVVVRNDLDPDQVGYIPPTTVKQTLESSGYERVAEFGPELTGGQIPEGTPLQIEGLFSRQRAVEIYQPAGDGGEDVQRPGPVGTMNAADAAVVSGGPESLLQLSADPDWRGRPALLAGDDHPGVDSPPLKVQSDGMRRADTRFGVVNNNTSYTYTADEKNPSESLQDPGDEPRMIVPTKGTEHQTTAVLRGAESVTASTSGNWMFHLPQFDPVNAFDGIPETGWAEGNPDTSEGEWLQVDFDEKIRIEDSIQITPLAGAGIRPEPVEIEVETDRGAVTSTLRGGGAEQTVSAPEGDADWLRVTILETDGLRTGFAGAGIAEVDIPGVTVGRTLQLPADSQGVEADAEQISLHRGSDPGGLNPAASEVGLQRQFNAESGDYTVTGKAMPMPGDALDSLLADLAPEQEDKISITAGSTLPLSPQLTPRNLVDGDLTTAWIAGRDQSLHLSWPEETEISEFVLAEAGGLSAKPTEVQVTTPTGAQTVGVDDNGWVRIPPVTTNQIDITVTETEPLTVHNPFADKEVQLPAGLTEVYFPELDEELRSEPPDAEETFELECGEGPTVSVDGTFHSTRVEGTLGDLADRRPVDIELCPDEGGAGSMQLDSGRHFVASGDEGALAVTDLTLTRGEPAAAGEGRTAEATDWAGDQRSVTVAEGDAAYLTTYENYNDGWKATLDGEDLEPVRLDGWQQGFLVPDGAGGEVELEYEPAVWYDTGIIAGVVAILLLAGFAFVRAGRRDPEITEAEAPPAPPAPGWVLGVLVLTLVMAVAAGPYALIVPALALLSRAFPRLLVPLALIAMTGAGIAALTGAGEAVRMDEGAFSGVAQALALLGLAAALVTADRPDEHEYEYAAAGGPGAPDPEAETAAFPAYGASYPPGAAPAGTEPIPRPGPAPYTAPTQPLPDEPDRPTTRIGRGGPRTGYGQDPAASPDPGPAASPMPDAGGAPAKPGTGGEDPATPPLGTGTPEDEPADRFVPSPPIPLSGTPEPEAEPEPEDAVEDTPPTDRREDRE